MKFAPICIIACSHHRRFVLIGTTNRNQFLVDSTGNRRFVPLEIGANFQIPWKELSTQRDHLWAAAVHAYRNGQGYEFNSGEIAAIAEYIQEFGDPDPWLDKVATYVAIRDEVSAAEILTNALELDPRSQRRTTCSRYSPIHGLETPCHYTKRSTYKQT